MASGLSVLVFGVLYGAVQALKTRKKQERNNNDLKMTNTNSILHTVGLKITLQALGHHHSIINGSCEQFQLSWEQFLSSIAWHDEANWHGTTDIYPLAYIHSYPSIIIYPSFISII
jgi:hypothetical protein